MKQIVDKLQNQAYRDSTRMNYHGVWKSFSNFYLKLDVKPKSWDDRITLLVAFLIHTKKKSTTIKSYVSALRATLKSEGICMNHDNAVLATLIKACKLKNNTIQTRLPIRKGLLGILINSLDKYYNTPQPYLVILFKALLAMTYFGMFRVGKVTKGPHVVKVVDMLIATNKDKLMFILCTSKTHNKGNKPQIIKVKAVKDLTGRG